MASIDEPIAGVHMIVPRVFRRDGDILCNSDDLRKHFGKRHDHVLRDVRDIMAKISPDLGGSWFLPTTVIDGYGRDQPAYDMTFEGFSILVMGWSGAKAMQFKVAYITEFNRMLSQKAIPQSDAAKLAMVRETRLTFGHRAAAKMWFALGLPIVPEMCAIRDQFEMAFDDSPATTATEVN